MPLQKRTEGASALYRGIGVKTAHSVLQSFVYFYCFATLRSAAEVRAGGRLGGAATLAVGTLAGWCNVLITAPLDTIATTKQARRRRRRAIPFGQRLYPRYPAPLLGLVLTRALAPRARRSRATARSWRWRARTARRATRRGRRPRPKRGAARPLRSAFTAACGSRCSSPATPRCRRVCVHLPRQQRR